MSERRPYCRVYWSVRSDPKFATVYHVPHRLGTWLQLLITADAIWPEPADLPRSVSLKDFRALVDCGLLDDLGAGQYRVHGLDAERTERRAAASVGGTMRAAKRSPFDDRTGTERVPNGMPLRAEPSKAEPSTTSRDGLPHIDGAAAALLEELTGRSVRQASDRNLTEYDRQLEDHGLPAVTRAYRQAASAMPRNPTARQLIWSARSLLEPFGDPAAIRRAGQEAEAQTEQAKRAERRDAEISARRLEAWRHTGKWDAGWGPQPEGDIA